MLFAIVSAISAAILALLFSIPLWTSGFFARLEAGGSPDAASHMVLFLFYVAIYTIINFVKAALKGIFTAALYRFAAGDSANGFFPADLIRHAIVPKI